MNTSTIILSAILSLCFLISNSFAQLTVDSDIDADVTWNIANSPVTVSNTITVVDGATLTIEPGVIVQMGTGTSIYVEGALQADGTESDRIIFTSTSATPGSWGSIEFRNDVAAGSIFNYVTVEYGAGASRSGMVFYTTGATPISITNAIFRNSAEHGINLRASSSQISNSEFYDNIGYGVFADLSLNFSVTESQIYRNTQGGVRVPINSQATISESLVDTNGVGILIENNGRPQITNNQINGNTTGIRIQEVGSSQPTISDNIIADNSEWGLESLGGNVLDARFNFWGSPLGPTVASNPTGNGDKITSNIDYTPWRDGSGMDLPVTVIDSNITEDTLWESGNVYLITINLTISNGNTLTIEPGTIVKFESGRSMTVNGALIANGEEQSLITFTSDRDDSAGGDSNEDGDATTPGPGNWGQINIESAGSEISHAIIRYGSSATNSGTLYIDAPISLSDLYINNNSRNGIYSEVSQSGWVNVLSVNNNSYGIYFRESALEMTGGETSHNGNDGLYFYSSDSNRPVRLYNFESVNNNGHGISINGTTTRNGTRIDSLMNSVISGNSSNGLDLDYSNSGQQYYSGNTVDGNSGHGVRLYHGMEYNEIVFDANQVMHNGHSGIVSNRAWFIDNTFEGNRFGIAAWRNLGHRYTDEADQDNNIFTGNTYEGIGLYATDLRDTLSATVPESFDHPTYILASSGTANSSSHTLLIEPGVTVKTASELVNSNTSLRFDGKLIAEGTEEDPIVFTSLFDHDFGGNVAAAGDPSTPSRGEWGGLHLNNNGTADSKLKHVYLRYGRTNLELGTAGSSQVEYTQPFEHLWVDNGSLYGVHLDEGYAVFTNLRATNNSRNGVWLRDRNSNGFVTNADIVNSEIKGNGGSNTSYAGLFAQSSQDGATFQILDNNIIEENSKGIVIENGSSSTSINGNIIRNNVHHGVQLTSNLSRSEIQISGNSVTGNGQTGILSSQAVFIDNTFSNNRFGIGAWKSLGHLYVDEYGVDGNSFSDNTYNNAIALYASSLRDTLSATVPEAFDHPTYIIANTGTANSSSHTLVIEPGVTVKTASELVNSNTSLRFDGKLIAEGTEVDPIVFTSLYDHDFGGNVAIEEDETTPSRGDWGGIHLNNNGTSDSKLTHVNIRYGRTNLEIGTAGSSQVEYSQPFENIWIDNGSLYGVHLDEGFAEFENLRATNNARHGVWLRDRNSNGFVTRAIIRNSEILNNGGTNSSYAGLYAQSSHDGAAFTEVTNSLIQGNSSGVFLDRSTLPSSIQFNEISSNNSNGIFARLVSINSDTALTVTGNSFNDHPNGVGIISTRAVIEDNTFSDNRLPIAVMDELSKDGTANEFGNFYDGNSFSGHTYKDAIGLYSTSSISLNGNLGYSWPAEFEKPAYIPIAGTTYINSGDSVNVAPGTVIKLGLNGTNDSFRVRGTIHAEGTNSNKIIFTSLRDDTYAGDTNRDSTNTAPARGNWRELLIDGSSSSQSHFKHVIVRYGNNNFLFDNDSEATIDSSFVSNANYGIYSRRGAKPTVRNSDIHSNRYGMRVDSNSDEPNIHLNNFYNNDDAGLYAFRDVTAINNYWGDSTGPFVDQGSTTDPNLEGEGDEILVSGSNRVEYEPWQVSRSGVLLGDVSESGSVSAFDASLILQYSVGDITLTTSQLAAADVSGDGTVSAFDASQILQFVVGIISGFDGAGKAPAFAPEDLFELDTIITDTYFDVIIKSHGVIPFYSGEMTLEYDETRFNSVDLIGTEETSNWSARVRAEDGVAKTAIAGVEPAVSAGDLIQLRFHFSEEFEGSPGAFEITSLVLNEIKLTEHASQVLTSQAENHELPGSFALDQNFPNPFNPATNIRFQLPVAGEVSVSIYNAIGQQVAILANRELHQAGVYTLNWDAGSSASGVYFYRLEVAGENGDNFMDVKKMTLIK